MKQNAFVTGADRGLGFALSVGLLERGWQVFAGQNIPELPELRGLKDRFPESLQIVRLDVADNDSVKSAARTVAESADGIDMLLNNAGVNSPTSRLTIREAQDYGEISRVYEVNALGPLRVLEAFLPLVDKGRLKRLCFVSSEAGSIGRAKRKASYAYCMSKAALNMSCAIHFNQLRPEGYTFRVYHPGWVRSYMGHNRGNMEPEEAARYALAYFLDATVDEDKLVMRDFQGKDWPW